MMSVDSVNSVLIKLVKLISQNLFQLVKLAKRLKKEKVNVDIINFGEEVIGIADFSYFLSNFIYVCSIYKHTLLIFTFLV